MLARSTPSTMQVIPTTHYEGTQSRPFAPLLPPRRPPRGPICETDAAATKLRPKGCQRILIRRHTSRNSVVLLTEKRESFDKNVLYSCAYERKTHSLYVVLDFHLS